MEGAVMEVKQCPVCWGEKVICVGLKDDFTPILAPCPGCDGTGWIACKTVDSNEDVEEEEEMNKTYPSNEFCHNCGEFTKVKIPRGQETDVFRVLHACPNCGCRMQNPPFSLLTSSQIANLPEPIPAERETKGERG